jgi:tripartite-type tricarboxylate transporter receptor subunit TctC
VHSQTFPNRPLRIIDGYPPGGATDFLARTIASKLTASVGQPVVVENRTGAGSNVGANAVAKAPPDGYTLFIGSIGTLATSRSLYSKLPYDVMKDLAPVTRVGTSMLVLVVNPSLPVKSIKDLVALAKSRPGQLNYASAGAGTATHLCVELLRRRAGITLEHIAYKGGGSFVTAVMGGEAAFGCITITAVMAQINAGRLKALAVTGPKRAPALADVPTIAESGYQGFDVTTNFGLLVPAATPKDVIALLNTEVRKVLDMADVRESFATQGVVASASTSEELRAILAAEVTKWAEVIKSAGIQIE